MSEWPSVSEASAVENSGAYDFADESPAARQIFENAKRDVALAGDGLARLRAIRDAAKRMALPVRHSTDKRTDKSSNSNLNGRLNEIAGKSFLGLTETHVWIAAKPA